LQNFGFVFVNLCFANDKDFTMDRYQNISKGGILGAVAGALASSKIYSKADTPVEKVVKTGTTAGLGYLLGAFLEKLFRKSIVK
jgi:hypothetical protein